MNKPVISVEELSKAYRIGMKDEIPDTLVGAMTGVLRAPFKNFNRLRKLDTFSGSPEDNHSEDTLWALNDVSFDVQEGEVVGIIGRNGAGKSTLLKVLSRITEPTSGRVVIRGRVSSLLEVGTGFHPELTGRDNIYMNGTILGMTKREIDRKFDEIVDFSGVEKFLDTPVKRYSSGMQVRLAFAVAAHLEPEILIIDEVLAVGDVEFQRKCLGKMQSVASEGRTVLFVSHNIGAVANLCTSGIVMQSGKSTMQGEINKVINYYNETFAVESNPANQPHERYREKWCIPYITDARFVNAGETYPPIIPLGGELAIKLEFSAKDNPPISSPMMGVVLSHATKGVVGGLNTRTAGWQIADGDYREGTLSCTIPKLPLLPGRYTIDIWLGDGHRNLDVLKQFLCFEIAATDYYESGVFITGSNGTVLLDVDWAFKQAELSSNI